MTVPLKNVPKNNYESFDQAWGGNSSPQEELNISLLRHFPQHHFKLYEGERQQQMVDSVKEFGILMPLIVWKNPEGEHIVLSGHNRLESAKLAGLDKVPVVVRENLTLDEATLIVTETNLRQRSFSDLSHSERAFSLAQHYEATKKQGKRKDLIMELDMLMDDLVTCVQGEHKFKMSDDPTCVQAEHKLKTRDRLAQESGISATTFSRYVKVSKLHPDLLELLDQGKLSFLSAYQLSFLPVDPVQQDLVAEIEGGLRISEAMAKALREDYARYRLQHQEEILHPPSQTTLALSGVKKILCARIPEQRFQNVEQILEEALDLYFQVHPEEA